MADEEFDGFFDMDELEEPSPFDLEVDDDGFLDEFDDPGSDDGGISRAFVFAAALITIAVVVVIVLLLWYAFSGDDGPTEYEQTVQAIETSNAQTEVAFYATGTALSQIQTATATAIMALEATATQAFFDQQTRAAVDAAETAAAQTAVAIEATAGFHATQTAESDVAATAAAVEATEAANATATSVQLTAEAEMRRLTVLVLDPNGQPIPNASVRLYRDDGDGEFDPEDRVVEPDVTPVPGATAVAAAPGDDDEDTPPVVPAGDNHLAYGEAGEGALGLGQTSGWVFEGSAGDEVSISAEALEVSQMDTFLEVFDPSGERLATNDDGGDGSNALIEELVLPSDGVYIIEVSSLAGEGAYTLRLFLTIVPADDDAGDVDEGDAEVGDEEGFAPPTPETNSSYHRPNRTDGLVLVSGPAQGSTPTPEGDALQDVQVAVQGLIDFGSLEPGVYWLELEYDSLPAVLQALAVPGEPLFIQVNVPEDGPVGEITFEFQPGVTPTPIPTDTPIPEPTATGQPTATPGGDVTADTDILSPTPTEEPGEIGDYGFFDEVNDSADGIAGTSGLTVLIIAAAGLVAVIFVARKLRS
ncbi:MAG: pre-peptidase C-terminal domain-containing protein [Anaerolineae bacterium]|nr:pre-peptidase C-terminal domain-containing protein [Anaerolineae bacterium]